MLVARRCDYCDPDSSKFSEFSWILRCHCNEYDGESLEWRWCKPESSLQSFQLSEDDKTITFHPCISWGTSVVRGTVPLTHGLHYWELKAVSPLYGTDVIVGIGRTCAKLDEYSREFRSVLGIDCNTWGLSYRGALMHDGQIFSLGSCAFRKGSIVGCLLDLWHFKLYFYVDGQLDPNACFNLIALHFPSGLREILCNTLPHSLFFKKIQQLSFSRSDVKQTTSLLPVCSPDPFLWTSFSPPTSNVLSSNTSDIGDFDMNPYSLDEFDFSSDLLNRSEGTVDEESYSSYENDLTTNEMNEVNCRLETTTSENSQKRRYQAAMSANSVLDRLFVLAAKTTKNDSKSNKNTSDVMRNKSTLDSVVYDHTLWGEFVE
ncbi:SPRY domain-containing SOCS box protein 3 [Schistosoma japonicum]|nr:SPRY domain-containing SOCS box protein 3 [Schistosoma japonicum]